MLAPAHGFRMPPLGARTGVGGLARRPAPGAPGGCVMKPASQTPATKASARRALNGGVPVPATDGDDQARRALLAALTAVADGDFSVRLPGDWTGLDGKIADTLQRDRHRQPQDGQGAGARRPGGGPGRQDTQRVSCDRPPPRGARWNSRSTPSSTTWCGHHRGDPTADGGRPGRPPAEDATRHRGPPAGGRVPEIGDDRQRDDHADGACSPRK